MKSMENTKRETFKSRIGFIMTAAGCAIGLGNVWRFPFITGQYGGAAFVLFYLLFLVILGLPVMTMEFAVGRASGKSAVRSFHALEPKGSQWHQSAASLSFSTSAISCEPESHKSTDRT